MLSTITNGMALLPLGKSIFPVVLLEGSQSGHAIHTKVDHNGIGISLGKVTKAAEHLCHGLPIWGLWLIKLAGPHILWILWLISISLLHLRVRGVILVLVLFVIVAILRRIPITASWWWSRPLTKWSWRAIAGLRIAFFLLLALL